MLGFCAADETPSAVDMLRAESHCSQFSDSSVLSEQTTFIEELTCTELDSKEDTLLVVASRKKKKKKAKKSTKSKTNNYDVTPVDGADGFNARQPALCISRNKHWKYISSYHGPWLQLPLELLESLLVVNLDPATVSGSGIHVPMSPLLPSSTLAIAHTSQPRGFARLRDAGPSFSVAQTHSPPGSPASSCLSPSSASLMLPAPAPPMFPLIPPEGTAAPPPIDPGVFRSIAAIRRLIDEAADLSVRASSGLSAAALGAMRNGGGGGGGGSGSGSGLYGFGGGGGPSWNATVQTLGLGTPGDFGCGPGGRHVSMSATRVYRLRALAVQKLAEAYKADEIATSVMVMGRGTVFDDIAERVLKVDPKNVDARYVHFFHEKIPSRRLAESTTTAALDRLIAENPQRLEFYRTRGTVRCFRDEYTLAVKDFTHVLKESRATRKARQARDPTSHMNGDNNFKKKRKSAKTNGRAPPSGTAPVVEGPQLLIHPSALPDAPDPIEPQVLFYRGAAYLAHALFLIEESIFKLEEVPRIPPNDFGEVQLSNIEHSKYGGAELGNPDGPLGRSDSTKGRAYREAFANKKLRDDVISLLRKSKRDHEKFLACFDTLDVDSAQVGPDSDCNNNVLQKMERAFLLIDTFRPNNRHNNTSDILKDLPLPFTTYHPLMLESHFSILNCLLMLGEFKALTRRFERSAAIVSGLECYPIFLPPRSMAQAEFVETLERLAGGWKYGRMPDPLLRVPRGYPLVSGSPSATHERYASPPSFALPSSLSSTDLLAAAGSSSSSSSLYTALTVNGNGKTNHSEASSSKITPQVSWSSGCGLPSTVEALNLDSETREESEENGTNPASINGQSSKRNLFTALEHLRCLLAPVHARLAGGTKLSVMEKYKDKGPTHGLSPTTTNSGIDTSLSSSGSGGDSVPNGKGKSVLEDSSLVLAQSLASATARASVGMGMSPKRAPLNFALHGARVEVILVWLAAVHLPELEVVADPPLS